LNVKIIFTVDLEDRYRGDAELLEACVRDGVLAFNRRAGHGARMGLVRLSGDEADSHVFSHPLRENIV
jgi:hypothetical protein